MFGMKDSPGSKNEAKHNIKNSNSNITVLAEDCEIKGTIASKGSIRIDGKVEGNVVVSGDLIIGQSASLKADIEAHNVSVAGNIQGNIKALELLELSSTAKLNGDVSSKQLSIEQGAFFNGRSTILQNTSTNTNVNKKSAQLVNQ